MASVSISANGVCTAPYIYSSATVSEKSRSGTSVTLSISLSTYLKNSSSYLGSGYTLTGTVTAYGSTKAITIKASSASWSGTTKHTNSATMSITVPASTTSITIGYKIKISGLDENNTVTGTNKSLTLSTVLASLTSAPDFNDEQNPTIKYSNPAGNSVGLKACISLTGSTDDIAYRDIPKTGTSYTFNLTEAERNVLRNACTTANSRKVRFYLRTVVGSTNHNTYLEKTLSIVNANPTFTAENISYRDTNPDTVAVTENDQKLVQNLSTMLATITSATSKKGASISKYEVTFNNATRTLTSAGNIDYGTVNSANDLTLSVKVTDSRGNTATASKNVLFLPWVLPSAIMSLRRKNNYEDETYLKVTASYSPVDDLNHISITYQYKPVDDENYCDPIPIENETEVTMIKDKEVAWDYKIILTDAFGSVTYNIKLPKGKFIFFVDTRRLSVGVNCFPKIDESFEVNGLKVSGYPVGSIYRTAIDVDPTTLFGGSWQLISKNIIDTGWQNFSWTNSTYIGTSQSAYTQNQWRVKDGMLIVIIGAGATASIDSGTEFELARIPIRNSTYTGSYKRVWAGGVGGGGAYGGFIIVQNADYISVHLKPHGQSSGKYQIAGWYSSFFTLPLENNTEITNGSYPMEYVWKRIE